MYTYSLLIIFWKDWNISNSNFGHAGTSSGSSKPDNILTSLSHAEESGSIEIN